MSDSAYFLICFSSGIRDASCSGMICSLSLSPHLDYPSFRDNLSLFTRGIKKYDLAHLNIQIFLVPTLVFFSRGKRRRKTGGTLFLSHARQLERKRGQACCGHRHACGFVQSPSSFLMCFISSLFEFLFGYLASSGGELNNHT